MIKALENFTEELSIVVIEDNLGDFVLIEDYLIEKFKSVNVVHQLDFTSAVAYLKNSDNQVSLILLDLKLPDKEGLDLINAVLALNCHVPIIILTGYSDLALAKHSLQIGISDYLIKDEINPIVLHKTICFALNRNSFVNHIEREKENYENLFNFNPQPTWLLEAGTFKILNANIAAQIKYGYTLDAFLKMSFTKLHPTPEISLILKKLKSDSVGLKQHDFTHILFDGKEIKVTIYATAINNSEASGLIVQSNDITKTLKRISTIELQNTKLKEIAWTQSHVVRAPLCRILGIVNLIEEEAGNLDDLQFWLKELRNSTNEMDQIVRKIVNQSNQFEKK
jgi:PAS domain S-box-containing protein